MDFKTETFIACQMDADKNTGILPVDCMNILKKHYGERLERFMHHTIRNMIIRLMRAKTNFDYFDEILKVIEEFKHEAFQNRPLKSSTFQHVKAEALSLYGTLNHEDCLNMLREVYGIGRLSRMKTKTVVNMIFQMLAIDQTAKLIAEIEEHVGRAYSINRVF